MKRTPKKKPSDATLKRLVTKVNKLKELVDDCIIQQNQIQRYFMKPAIRKDNEP